MIKPSRSRQTGNCREDRFADLLEEAGYVVAITRGSRGEADIWALHDRQPHLMVAIIRPTGSITEAWKKLRGARAVLGSIKLVAKETKTKGVWRIYTSEDRPFFSLSAAIADELG